MKKMQIFESKKQLQLFINAAKLENKIIGFVPTMGALHQGHISLVQRSLRETDLTVVSIFVNPTQFNNADDLEKYPRNLSKDISLLEMVGCHVVFAPAVDEMYPEQDNRRFDFDGIDNLMEGEHRPGHFNGVAQIVSKLFDAVQPDKAYFGQKDFQQVAIIRKMVEKLRFNIEIIPCQIVREKDGLAMSSRNQLLTKAHRDEAPLIFKVLNESIKKGKVGFDIIELKKWVTNEINKSALLKVEYFDLVNEYTLQPIERIDKYSSFIGCIAVWAGSVRLIDNIIYNY